MTEDKDIYIYNALDKDVNVQAFGNYYNLKSRQVKRFRSEIGDFIAQNKGYLGLVGVSDEFDDSNFKNTQKGKDLLAQARAQGVNNRIVHLEWQRSNLMNSLAQDLAAKEMNANVLTFASKGDLEALEELTSYKKVEEDERAKRMARLSELEKDLKSRDGESA